MPSRLVVFFLAEPRGALAAALALTADAEPTDADDAADAGSSQKSKSDFSSALRSFNSPTSSSDSFGASVLFFVIVHVFHLFYSSFITCRHVFFKFRAAER